MVLYVDCFRHSRGLEWPIWTKFFAWGYFLWVWRAVSKICVFFYTDPSKKSFFSEVGPLRMRLYRNFSKPSQIIQTRNLSEEISPCQTALLKMRQNMQKWIFGNIVTPVAIDEKILNWCSLFALLYINITFAYCVIIWPAKMQKDRKDLRS